MPRIWFNEKERISRRILAHKGRSILERAMQYGKGIIVAVPYVGNWEIVAYHLSTLGGKTLLSATPPVPEKAGMVWEGRFSTGATLVSPGEREEPVLSTS